MRKDFTHALAVSWTSKLNQYTQKEGVELQKMTLGMEIFLHNIPRLVLLAVVAVLLGVLPQFAAILLPFSWIRKYACGLHARNGLNCTVVSLLLFVAVPFVLHALDIQMNAGTLVLVFVLISICLFKYAPADTAARPILGEKKRARLKRNSVIASIVLLILALLLLNETFYGHVALGVIYATVSVLPITYKILGRSMKNYEQHEREPIPRE